MPPRLRPVGLRALLVVVSTLLALAMCEAGLRIADYPKADWSPWIKAPFTGTAYAPHLSQRWTTAEFDITYRTNSDGMRDDEIGPKRGYRVVVLGDSFAAGYGVEREQQFADLLERQLGVEVVNAATGGWELEHQYYYVKERGGALEPDLVLYAMYLGNDIIRNGARPLDSRGIVPDPRLPDGTHGTPKLVLLWERARHAWQSREAATRPEWTPHLYLDMSARKLTPAAARNYETTREFLGRLRDEVARVGSSLVVAFFSYRTAIDPTARERLRSRMSNFDRDYDLEQPPREIEGFLRELRIAYVDLNVPLKQAAAESPELLYYERDGHWTPRAHRVVADALRAALEPRVRVPAERPSPPS